MAQHHRGASLAVDYARDGFVVVPRLFDVAAVAELNAEALAVAAGLGGATGLLAIHFPHKLSPHFRAALHAPAVVAVLTALIGPDVKAIQSMLFIKPPGKPGQAWHQDEHFLPTRDRSLCGVWIALDDATIDNGCLWAWPGSHAPGILYPMRAHADPRFDASDEAQDFPQPRDGGTALEIAAGDAIFFNGYLLHRSLPNRSAASLRRAYVCHYMNARSLLPWNHDGASPTEDFRDIELVAGTDPYAWKGIADLSRPFVRAERSS